MKDDIDSIEKVNQWLVTPRPAIFQGQDLRELDADISGKISEDCVFLGCEIGPLLGQAIAKKNCSIIHRPKLAFNPFKSSLYSPEELYDYYDVDKPLSYMNCLDRKIYCSYVDCTIPEIRDNERPELQVDLNEALMRRIHDWSISDALHELIPEENRPHTVAIMGGHDVGRDEGAYKDTVNLAHSLAKSGFFVITGGGPGLMEAANMGSYLSGFNDGIKKLDDLIKMLSNASLYNHKDWLQWGFKAKEMLGIPDDLSASKNLGIPTWFYGHEPPNVFATDIAKYFENSVREEGLLAIAWGGIIFAKGNGGTVQEIFQDANQNYYRLFGKRKSPMVLFGVDFWNPLPDGPIIAKQKPVYPLLLALAKEKDFSEMIMLSDSSEEILNFIRSKKDQH